MTVFDPATAKDLADAIRLLEGRLAGSGRALSPGAREISRIVSGSGRVRTGQPLGGEPSSVDDGPVVELLTLGEVAYRLRSSESTVKRLVKDGRLPVVHIGRRSRVRPHDLETFVEALPTGSGEEES